MSDITALRVVLLVINTSPETCNEHPNSPNPFLDHYYGGNMCEHENSLDFNLTIIVVVEVSM